MFTSILGTLRKLFTLKPYGNHLVDGMTETWLFLAALNILAIAFCDAVAWGYFGYTTAHGPWAYAAGAIAGLIVFALVGSLDAMFIMHDRSRQPEAAEGEGSRKFTIRRDHLAIGARIVLVILTFTVTAPFLTQLFFERDIAANIRRRNEQTIAARRDAVAAAFDRRSAALRAQVTSRQRDLEREIAGSGTSGRYGKGPTAAAIEREVGGLQADIGAVDQAKQSELAAFDRATANPEELASRYGVDLVREGPDTRARVIAELEKSPSFRATRLAIKAFLLFMFLGLVCLKLFQPDSVRIYYSAPLQAAWGRAQLGLFDQRIDAREHPSVGRMSPVRFADWYENDQLVRDMTARLREQTALSIERLKAQEDAARALHESLRLDITAMQEDLASAAKANEDLEQQVEAAEHELSVLTSKISEQQRALDAFRQDETEELPLADQRLLIISRNRTAQSLADNRAAAAKLTASLTRLTRRLEATRNAESHLRQSLAASNSEMSTLTKALHEARQRRVSDIFAAG